MKLTFFGVVVAAEAMLFFLGGWPAALGAIAGGLMGSIPFLVISEWKSMRRYNLTPREIFRDWCDVLNLTRRH